jgi:hypothetical protein
MVKVIGLAVAVAACWTCAPAQAGVLPIEPPSATVPAAGNVGGSVSRVVDQVGTSSQAVPVPADPTVRNAKAAAEPAVRAAVTTTTVQVAQGRAGDSGGLRVGASSLRRVPSARLRRPAAAHEASAPARSAPAPRSADRSAVHVRQAPAHASASDPATARPERNALPHPLPGLRADGGVATVAAGMFAGGLALLTGALMLVAPRLRRRLAIHPAVPRPVAFVALLERPG